MPEISDVHSDLVLAGGTVLTGDHSRPLTDAVAVADGRVVALGDEARQREARAARTVDLAGRTLLPGFRDGHVHPLHAGEELLGPSITGAGSIDELLDRLQAWAAAHPDLPAVAGGGYDPTLAPDGLFDAAALDRVVPDRPVLLASTDHHALWVNSAAFAAAGIDATTPDPAGGVLVRRPDGSLLGTVLESAIDLFDPLLPDLGPGHRADGLRRGLAELARVGIVWAQDAVAGLDDVPVWLGAAERGELTCRVDLALRASPEHWRDQLERFVEARAEVAERGRGLLTARNVKLFADGVIEGGTGAVLDPYVDSGGCGILNWPQAELEAATAAFDAAGFQLHVHAIGDAGVRAALDAIERLAAVNGPRDRRPVLAHLQLVHPDDRPRFAALGVVANFEPLWAQLDPVMVELTIPRLGPDRAAAQYPIASLLHSGARLSFGSDWPVTSLDPLHGIEIAVTRRTPAGHPDGGWTPHERLSLAAALAAYTSGTAWQAFEEEEAGVIAVGRRADLCLLGADLAGGPGEVNGLAGVPVEGTWLAGTEVFRC
jgi:predicted amidohydrolase YtcJ